MTTTTSNPAASIIRKRTTRQLVADFLVTAPMRPSLEVAIVRGWLLDEIEYREPDRFLSWLDADAPDEDLPRYILG